MTNYDFINKEFSFTSINIARDLHCWQMSFNWIPIGFMRSYNLNISVKSSILQDLKLQRRRTWYDNNILNSMKSIIEIPNAPSPQGL